VEFKDQECEPESRGSQWLLVKLSTVKTLQNGWGDYDSKKSRLNNQGARQFKRKIRSAAGLSLKTSGLELFKGFKRVAGR
jgi:hypothetical protein